MEAWEPRLAALIFFRSAAPDEQLNGAAHCCMFCIQFHVPSCRYHAWEYKHEMQIDRIAAKRIEAIALAEA